MLTSYNRAYKSLVFVRRGELTNVPIGYLVDFVIDPHSGIFKAIWVRVRDGLKLLSFRNITSWTEYEIYIDSEDDLVFMESFPRLKKILDQEVPILGNSVFMVKTKAYLGKVTDFSFDTVSPRILSLSVKKGFWIFGSSRIIHHKKISKITEEGIFIHETGLKIKTDKSKVLLKKKLKSTTEITGKQK